MLFMRFEENGLVVVLLTLVTELRATLACEEAREKDTVEHDAVIIGTGDSVATCCTARVISACESH